MKSSEQRAFFRIFLSYLSVLLVPVTIGIIIYFSSVSSMTRMVRNYSRSMLSQSVDIIDARLQEMESIPFYLQSMPELINLSGYEEIPEGGSDNYEVYKVYQHLPKFSLINSYIKNLQIILLNNGFVVSESNALRLTPQTYSGLLSFTGMDYDAFQEFSTAQFYSNDFVQFKSNTGTITPALITSTSSTASRYPWALVIIQLKESALQNTMAQLLIDPGSIALLLDNENNLITSVQGREAMLPLEDAAGCISLHSDSDYDYQNYIVSTIESSYNGWKYCVFSPREAVMANMNDANRSVVLLVALAFVMSITFTSILGMHKAASLKKVVNYLSGGPLELNAAGKDEFSYIINAASGLVTSNQELRQSLQSQKPLLEAAVLRNSLSGAINKPEELKYLFTTLDIKPDGQKFAVVLIDSSILSGNAQPELTQYPVLLSALAREYIEKNADCPVYCLDMDSRQKAVILIGEDTKEEAFLQQIRLFSSRTRKAALAESVIDLAFYASDIYSMVDDLPKAYHQAVVVSQHASRSQEQSFYTSRDIPEIQKLYYYPIQTELELLRLIKTGSQNDLGHLLDTIKNANFLERSLSSSMTRQLIFAVRNSVLRGLSELPQEQLTNEAFSSIQQATGFDELADAILRFNQYLVRVNNQLNSEKNERKAEKMLQYINNNYTRDDFTIYSICEEFHISESFAYQIFREVIGTSFADLLEQIRIEKACQMLSEKTYLIKDIALAVGYTNDNSFRRAFKRVMGVTPGEFTSSIASSPTSASLTSTR